MANLLHLLGGSIVLLVVQLATAQEISAADIDDLSKRNAAFATRLYRAVAGQTDDNVLLSPLLLSMGLSAVMSGAKGSTQEQLLHGLSLAPLDPQRVPDLFQSLMTTITKGAEHYQSQGFAVLPSQGVSVSAAYQDTVQTKYGGSIQSVAYTSPEEAKNTINTWALTRTAEQVQDVVRSIDPQTKMLLTTTAYYQSQFSLVFNSTLTQDERFYVNKYHIVSTPMMFRSDKYYLAYDRALKLGVLKLPTTDGGAMLVLLPDEGVDVTAVEEEISAERFQGWLKQLKKTKLEVQLPRFLLEQTYSLQNLLTGLGISDVFQDRADLSAIGDTGLKLTEVLHKARIAVDETSNAVGGGVTVFSSLPPRLTINRPFLFLIYQQQTSSIVYMGRVVDPTKK